jgi:hypothetical protein
LAANSVTVAGQLNVYGPIEAKATGGEGGELHLTASDNGAGFRIDVVGATTTRTLRIHKDGAIFASMNNSGLLNLGDSGSARTWLDVKVKTGDPFPYAEWVGLAIDRTDASSDAFAAGLAITAYQDKGAIIAAGGFGLSISTYTALAAPTERIRINGTNGGLGIGIDPGVYGLWVRTNYNGESALFDGHASTAVIIEGSTSPRLRLTIGGVTKGYVWAATTYLAIGLGSTANSMFFDGTNAAIGTTDPSGNKLRVMGSLRVDGNIYLTGDLLPGDSTYASGSVAGSGTYVLPRGVYLLWMASTYMRVDVYGTSSWSSTVEGFRHPTVIFSDGTNVRITNTGLATDYYYYRKF